MQLHIKNMIHLHTIDSIHKLYEDEATFFMLIYDDCYVAALLYLKVYQHYSYPNESTAMICSVLAIESPMAFRPC